MRGISKSTSSTSGCRDCMILTASTPSRALRTWNPESLMNCARERRALRESSTTSARGAFTSIPVTSSGRTGRSAAALAGSRNSSGRSKTGLTLPSPRMVAPAMPRIFGRYRPRLLMTSSRLSTTPSTSTTLRPLSPSTSSAGRSSRSAARRSPDSPRRRLSEVHG